MKKIIYNLIVLITLILTGCVQENLPFADAQLEEGTEVRINFTVQIPEFITMKTRANGGVNDMMVLLFDENNSLITRKIASLTDQTETGGTFTVTLPSSMQTRYVHFICNYDWSTFNDNAMLGANAATVVALMNTNNATFWAYKQLAGINANSFDGETVSLLRNQAKISVINSTNNFTLTGFTIHKKPIQGTVAPFNPSTAQFEIHSITEPIGVGLINAQQSDISMTDQYLFERKNKNAATITTVIVEGIYSGNTYFYKIDLIDKDNNNERYDIERNYHYTIDIKSVTKEGYANFNDALNGASHNNTVLDPIIEKYPMISNGVSKLEVEKTLVIFVEPNKPLNVWTKYYPDVNSTTVNNTGVTVTLASNEGALADGSLSFNRATGIITVMSAATISDEPTTARIVVKKDDLARTIRVILRSAFSFNPVSINDANPITLPTGQNESAILRFYIPDDFPTDLLPLPIKIYTQGLYPASAGMQMMVEGGVIHYVYKATTVGRQRIDFKTNQSGNEETVTLKADYFINGLVNYTTPYKGNITYGSSNTQVPASGYIIVSTGEIKIISDGRYRYTPPSSNPNMNTPVTISYYKQINQGYYEKYTVTTTIRALYNGETMRLMLSDFVFTGSIKYSSGWYNVPYSGNVSIVSGPGTIQMTGDGAYQCTVSVMNSDATSIRFRYSNYYQTKTISQLKTNSSLWLQ